MQHSEEFQKLLAEAIAHGERSDMLLAQAGWIRDRVNEMCAASFDEMDEWSEEEKVAYVRKCNEMLGRMKVTWEELVKTDNEYHALREKVNAYFGKEVLENRPRVTRKEFLG